MFARLARLSDRLLATAAVLLVLAMLGAVFFGVVFRSLNRPLAWTDELGQYLLVWTGFVGWIIAGNRGSHIRVTVLVNRLRGRARQAAEIATHLLVAMLGVVLLTRSFGLIGRNLLEPVAEQLLAKTIPLPRGRRKEPLGREVTAGHDPVQTVGVVPRDPGLRELFPHRGPQPANRRLELAARHAVPVAGAFASRGHQPQVGKHLEVPADGRLRQLEGGLDLTHGELLALQHEQQPAPDGVGERAQAVEDGEGGCHVSVNPD
jgi:TRAP-type C4-dicarboxylate transport system permease small subunit